VFKYLRRINLFSALRIERKRLIDNKRKKKTVIIFSLSSLMVLESPRLTSRIHDSVIFLKIGTFLLQYTTFLRVLNATKFLFSKDILQINHKEYTLLFRYCCVQVPSWNNDNTFRGSGYSSPQDMYYESCKDRYSIEACRNFCGNSRPNSNPTCLSNLSRNF